MRMRSNASLPSPLRSCHSSVKRCKHAVMCSMMTSRVDPSPAVIRTSEVNMSDHSVSLLRSSQGKSNSVASIFVVRSRLTSLTQSNDSFSGSESSTSMVRSRISVSNS